MRFNFDYPNPVDINTVTKKASFFLGDRWVEIGPIEFDAHTYRNFRVPDVQMFLEKRERLNDGTLDWLEWGPRMN